MADGDVRLSWKLPLLGSAEMNRIQPIRAGRFTSRLYPVVFSDPFQAIATPGTSEQFQVTDNIRAAVSIVGGLLTSGYQLLTAPTDTFRASMSLLSGSMAVTTVYGTYTNWAPENFQASFSVLRGSLEVTTNYITYNNWAPEHFRAQVSLIGGSLT